MSERDPHRWSRFAASVAALIAMVVVVPIGLIAVSRSRFGSANPLAGADPPWEWGSNDVGDALAGPLADDTVIDGIIRLSLCVVWVALAVIIVTTVVEVVHAVRHHGLSLPNVRGVGWAQPTAVHRRRARGGVAHDDVVDVTGLDARRPGGTDGLVPPTGGCDADGVRHRRHTGRADPEPV